jgi:hypothetical protein
MSNVTTKVASTLLIGVAAAAVSTVLPLRSVNAADSCLTEPKGDAQGKHWYYHIERGTGRHCWYQRGEDDKSARSDDDDRQAASDKAPSRSLDPAAARSFADAHAEITPKTAPGSSTAAAAPSVWPAPTVANAPAASNATAAASNGVPAADSAPASNSAPAQAAPDGSSLASRWPQQAADDTAPPSNPQPDASLMVADAQDNTTTGTDTPPPPSAVAAPPERQIGSIQKLLMVAFGALTLAGLTGSAVYRLGHRRRRNDWLRERNSWQDAQNPNRPPWVDEPRLHSNLAVADLDERHHAEPHFAEPHHAEPQSDLSLTMDEPEADSERVEKIEDFLARLTKQLHAERQSARPHNAA